MSMFLNPKHNKKTDPGIWEKQTKTEAAREMVMSRGPFLANLMKDFYG